MILRGQDYGHVLNSSGARGFMGEGYWFHRLWRPFGLDYSGSTFVAKTTTFAPRAGNMPLSGLRPADLVPKCIVVKPLKGVVLNSVGLSGPGAHVLVDAWERAVGDGVIQPPFMISFMSVAASAPARVDEARQFCELVKKSLLHGGAVQVNFSCPNVGLDVGTLASEVSRTLDALEPAGMALLAKVNALFPTDLAASALQGHRACDGVVVSNTIPWGKLPDRIAWKRLFGSDESPLADLGGGGLSGKPLLPLVREWIVEARKAGLTKPVVGGGGILCAEDAESVLDAGADAVELGSVSILRPWRVAEIIKRVNGRFG